MHALDAIYLGAVGVAGALARGLMRGLGTDVRLRLEARPPEGLAPGWLWLHAVSVGELLLAEGLVGRLAARGHRVHVTTGTAAGLGLLEARAAAWDAGRGLVSGGAFPLDDPRGLAPFFAVPPGAFLALETELWPNLIRELARRGIPRLVVNGRLTARSTGRGGPWIRRAASRLTRVVARDPESQAAFRELGAPDVVLGGNLKADLPPPRPLHAGWAPLREAWAQDAVVIAGNTVPGEEALVLAAFRAARAQRPGLRLILAPRRPARFPEVAAQLQEEGWAFRQASEPWPEEPAAWADTAVLLLDTLGELAAAYGEGSAALVGGGWTWHGGHNPVEPAAAGLPVLIGPGYENFSDLVNPLKAAGFLQVVGSADLPTALAARLAEAPLRPAPRLLPEGLGGALERTLQLIDGILPEPPRDLA
jgi:3-deoxy-D-manno-octulosonic-acid transferase